MCLLTGLCVQAQDGNRGKGELWGEIWKHIHADNEKMRENNSSPSNGLKSELPGKRDEWIELLQNRLDEESSPWHTASTKTPTTTTAKASKKVDVKQLLAFLKAADITLSNDQWMSLLQYVLETKPTTSSTTTISTTTPSPSRTINTIDSAVKESSDKEDWLGELAKGLNTDHEVESAQQGAESTRPPNKTGPTTTLKLVSNTSTSSAPHAPSSSSLSLQTSTAEPTLADKKNQSISEKQWEVLLDRYFDGDAKSGNHSEVGLRPTEARSRSDDVVSDKEWERALQEMMDGKDDGEKTSRVVTTATPETQRGETVSAGDDDTEWERLLQEAMDGSTVRRTTPSATPTPTTTSRKNDDRIGDRQWLRLLERVIDKIDKNDGDDEESDVIGDRQWLQLLDGLLDRHLSPSHERKVEQATRPSVAKPTKAPNTTPLQRTESKDTEEPETVSDQKWEEMLRKAMDNNGQGHLESAKKAGDETQNVHHKTNRVIDYTNGVVSEEITPADDHWEKSLSGDKIINDQETATESPTSELPRDETTTKSLSTDGQTFPKSPSAHALAGIEEVENDVDTHKNFTLLLMFGIGSGVLLVILIAAVALTVCRRKGLMCWSVKDKHTTVLNSDGNRWDPQVLRPSKENMNAFLYSIPMPMKEVKIDY